MKATRDSIATTLSLRRRELIAGAQSMVGAPNAGANAAGGSGALPASTDGDARPQLELARRVFAAPARVGEPWPAPDLATSDKLADAGRLMDAAHGAVFLRQPQVLVP